MNKHHNKGGRIFRVAGRLALTLLAVGAARGADDSVCWAAATQAAAAWTRAQQLQADSNRWVATGVVADRITRSVTLVAEATGLEYGGIVEFLLLEQGSDRGYEALAVSLAAPNDISRALEFIGLPPGYPVTHSAFRFWPKGERVRMSFAPLNGGKKEPVGFWVTNQQTRTVFDNTLVYVGRSGIARLAMGPRGEAGMGPGAVAATYNEPTALLDVPEQASQSAVYGNRSAGARILARRELLRVILQAEERPAGSPRVIDLSVTAQPVSDAAAGLAGLELVGRSADPAFPVATNDVRDAFKRFAALAQSGRDPFVALTLDDRLTVVQARDLAKAFAAIEGVNGIRMDAPPSGQLYYKAFLPNERWRVRKDRLTQPWELRIARKDDGWVRVLVEIRENWGKADQLDPDLTVIEHPFNAWDELPVKIKALGGGLGTLLVFAPADAPLSAFMPGARAVHATQPMVFVFAE